MDTLEVTTLARFGSASLATVGYIQGNDSIQLVDYTDYGLIYEIFVGEDWAARKRVDPVLVPQAVKHDTVQLRFKHVVIDFVVLVGVQTKVVNFSPGIILAVLAVDS